MTLRARIEAIEYYLPEKVVTNDDLGRENPSWDMAAIEEKAGVQSRHVAAQGETALDLARRACDRLFRDRDKSAVDAVIFCTQSPDYIMPPNSHLLQAHLGLGDEVIAFDFNLACSGYIYGLAMAESLVRSGMARRILLATADTYSKYIHPRDRSARVLFGDGAAVTLLGATEEAGGFVDFKLASRGREFSRFYIPAGGLRTPRSPETSRETTDWSGNVRTQEHIHMDGLGVWSFINSAVPRQIQALLEKSALRISDIDLFLFHQASRMTLDSLAKVMGIEGARLYNNLAQVGNTVSASVAIALKDAIDEGAVSSGDRLILSGFGVGLSYASALYKHG